MVIKGFERRYEKGLIKLLNDQSICEKNRTLFKEFFEHEEYKLKRINNLRKLDSGTYKTLYGYILKFKNINKWFKNKPLVDITKEDIKQVYDDLEDGKILNFYGKPFRGLEESYYGKIFKSKLFEMAGKLEDAQSVIQYTKNDRSEVKFITESGFRKILNNAYKPLHRLLLWLAWDIGENIGALLKLKKCDFYKQQNPYTKEFEYRVNLKNEILKRSRKPRSEITNYNETIELLNQELEKIENHELLFKFDYRNSKKIIDRAVARAGVKCIPNGEKPSWKDLRSGMACDLLSKGWSSDQVNARLGHKPSSDEIDKYINFLAIDRHTPKKKIQQFEMSKLKDEINEIKLNSNRQIKQNELLEEKLQVEKNERMKLNEQMEILLIQQEKLMKMAKIKRLFKKTS